MTDVLVIDTSTNAVAVACGSSNTKSSSRCVSQQSFHSENILVAIDEVLKERSIGPAQISAVGVGIGPGLFTGLRVGITAAHSFAHALGIPLVYFSSLELTALSSLEPQQSSKQHIIVARDARRHELYFAKYSLSRIAASEFKVDTTIFSTCLDRVFEECLVSPKEFVDRANEDQDCLVVLDDEGKYEEFLDLDEKHRGNLIEANIDASTMIDHVVDSVMAGIVTSPFAPSALYIRKSDAELSWGTK